MKVVVVGAGMAGLTAVHELRKAGVDVVCYESAGKPGGRVISARRDGFVMDMGAQFFFRSYDTCFGIAEELGLSKDYSTWEFRGGFPNKGRFLPIVASIVPKDIRNNLGETISFLLRGGLPYSTILQLLKMLPTLVCRYKDLDLINFERSLDMDMESITDFTLRKGGRSLVENFFQSVASTLTLAMPEELSAAYGLGLLWNMINGLTTFKNGLGCITEGLAEKYADSIKCGTPVDRIVIEQGKVKGVEVNGSLVKADAVVSAVTATKLLDMAKGLPEGISRALQTVKYSACCHVIFALPKPLLPKDWYAIVTPRNTDSLVSGFSDNAVKSPNYAPSGCSQISCWTYHKYARELNDRTDEEIKKIMVKELQRFVPSMPNDPLFMELYRWREAVCVSPPGMLTAMARMKRDSYRDVKGLYLAGEYLNMPSVESAAYSGVYAAKAALQQ